MIPFVTAVAWPVASVIIVLTARSIIKIIMTRAGKIDFSYKDLLKIAAHSSVDSEKVEKQDAVDQPLALPQDQPQETKEPSVAIASKVEMTSSVEDNDQTFSGDSLFTAKNATDLALGFNDFKLAPFYLEDPDFWETFYVTKRRQIGVGNYVSELETLSVSNPSFIWPLIYLVQEQRELFDLKAAEEYLKTAFERSTLKNRRLVLNEAMRLYFKLSGFESAFSRLVDYLKMNLSEEERAGLFSTLGHACKSDGDADSYLILSELALVFSPEDKSARFDLAYEYAQLSRLPIPAYRHYRQLTRSPDDTAGTSNNLGVLVGEISAPLRNDFYAQSVKMGNRLAAANLARALADNGFVSVAEDLLARFTEGDEHLEHYARAQAQVLSARRELEKQRSSIDGFVDTQYARYRAALMDAYRSLCREGTLLDSGVFTTSDGSHQVYLSTEGAACRLPFGAVTIEGVVPRKANCFFGSITSASGNPFSSVSFLILIAPVPARSECCSGRKSSHATTDCASSN